MINVLEFNFPLELVQDIIIRCRDFFFFGFFGDCSIVVSPFPPPHLISSSNLWPLSIINNGVATGLNPIINYGEVDDIY